MIDIHTHILPYIDDGSNNMNESINMVKMLLQQGCSDVFFTPHSWGNYQNINKCYYLLKKIFPETNLYLGNEILVDNNIDNVIEELDNGDFLTMNNTNCVLIEFDSFFYSLEQMKSDIDKLLHNRYIPIIAHIERYRWIKHIDIQHIKDFGAKIQINLYSLNEEKNPVVKSKAVKALNKQLVDFVGSDCHKINHRPPCIKNGVKVINQICDKDYAEKILFLNAKKYLIEN